MAWTAPSTWTSATLTAAQLNTQLRDNMLYLSTDKPIWYVSNSVAQSTATATQTAITYDTEAIDNANLHSTTTNTSRITFATTGKYLAGVQFNFASNATGYRQASFYYNGVATGAQVMQLPVTGVVTSIVLTTILSVTASSYLETFALQTSGGALTVTASFWGYFVGF
jgi:hypothetical protein